MRHTDQWYKDTYGYFPEDEHEGIKSEERVKEYAEVLTPKWLVEKMIDMVAEASEEDVKSNQCANINDPKSTVFEPCCGEGAFITSVLKRKLSASKTYDEKLLSCKHCYGIDIQYDNVLICRDKLTKIAKDYDIKESEARFIFARNIIHGDMLFFPMIARFYDWDKDEWTTLEDMENEK